MNQSKALKPKKPALEDERDIEREIERLMAPYRARHAAIPADLKEHIRALRADAERMRSFWTWG